MKCIDSRVMQMPLLSWYIPQAMVSTLRYGVYSSEKERSNVRTLDRSLV